MNTLISGLKTRYDAAFQASSDSEFYQNIHAYIDFIVKTPALFKIMDDAEMNYHKKHYDIWHPRTEDEKENEQRAEQTRKMERFDLYAAHYATLYLLIYFPLEDYKTTHESDKDQDPVALIMIEGLKNVLARNWGKDPEYYLKWNRSALKAYSRRYEGKREFYENELRQFNLQFINEVEKIKEKPVVKDIIDARTKVFIDESEGIYRIIKDKKVNYSVGRDSKRFRVIKYLAVQEVVKLSKLEELTGQRPPVIIQEINKINKSFREKLKLGDDLIIHHKTGGYSLNKKKIDFQYDFID